MAYIVGVRMFTGDKPGKGTYRCMRCNWRATLEDHNQPLPLCGGDCKVEPSSKQPPTRYERIL